MVRTAPRGPGQGGEGLGGPGSPAEDVRSGAERCAHGSVAAVTAGRALGVAHLLVRARGVPGGREPVAASEFGRKRQRCRARVRVEKETLSVPSTFKRF